MSAPLAHSPLARGPFSRSLGFDQGALFGMAHPVPTSISLRPYQTSALAEIETHRAPGARILCVAPTGAGKTTIFCQLALDELARGGRVLVVAHRTELIEQAFGRLVVSGVPEHAVGVLMADGVITHPVSGQREHCARPRAPVQVASIDTLRERLKRTPAILEGITLVIIDECHRALAKSYRAVFDALPRAVHIGFTATPYRGDGRGLGDVYQVLVVVTTPKALMADRFLSEPRVYSHPHRADLTAVKTVAGDYDEEQLAEACNKRELVGSIVEHWREHLAGVRTVAFAVNVAHSKHIVEQFQGAGVPAEHLDGTTHPVERKAILARIDRGETLVVSNCNVLTEGWDQPSVKGCILARPTKSRAIFVQQAGRVLRPYEDITPVILDHAGCVLEHDLPHADWEITLDGKKKRAKQSVSIKECPRCFGAIPSVAKVCSYCGHVFETTRSDDGDELAERDGRLVLAKDDPARALARRVKNLRGELQQFAERVDEHYRLPPGSTNGAVKRRFRKPRPEMDLAELEAVRGWLLTQEPWLAVRPNAFVRFAAPRVEAATW